MKCSIVITIITVVFLFLNLPPSATALPLQISDDESGITISITLPAYKLTVNPGGKASIEIPEYDKLSSPGDPQVPYQQIRVAVPPDIDPAHVHLSIVALQEEPLEGEYYIPPVSPMATWDGGKVIYSWGGDKNIVDGKNIDIYEKNRYFPDALVRLLSGSRMRKWRIVTFEYCPIQYNPVSKKIKIIRNIELRLIYPERKMLKQFELTELRDRVMDDVARSILSNYALANSWYEPRDAKSDISPSTAYNLVILTTQAIKDGSANLSVYEDHKESMGRNVLTVTESYNYDDLSIPGAAGGWGGETGDTAANNIRNWLQNNYSSLGIEYALLIGDPNPTTGNLPMKMCWPRSHESSYQNAPTDYFFAELTSNWDQDSDGLYGEWESDIGSTAVYADIYVGRIPVYGTSYSDLDNILQKMINYELDSGSWKKKVLLPMKPLDSLTPGYRLGEAIKYDFADPSGFISYRIYDKVYGLDPPPEMTPCSKTNVINEWQNLYGLVIWDTHGSSTEAISVFDVNSCQYLNDSYPSITFQVSCNNGFPENSGNLGYSLLKKGCVGAISASRVCWCAVGDDAWWIDGTASWMAWMYSRQICQLGSTAGAGLYHIKEGTNLLAEEWMNDLVFNLYGDPYARPHVTPLTPTPTASPVSPTPTPSATSSPLPTPQIAWYDMYGPNGSEDVVIIDHMYVASMKTGIGCANNAKKTQPDAITWADELNWLEQTDWRIPTQSELSSIYGGRSLLGSYAQDFYWSSSTTDGTIMFGLCVSFTNGSVVATHPTYNFYVRAVRDYFPSPTPIITSTPTPLPSPTKTSTPIPPETPTPESTVSPTPVSSTAPWITDYDGDGTSDIAIFRTTSGLWAVRGITRAYFGTTGDIPVPGDYTGDGTTNIAIFRESSGLWAVSGGARTYFGGAGDVPVPGDYSGNGTADVGIYRSTSGLWAIRGVTRAYFGGSSDSAVPGYYGSDGKKSIGIFRPASGLWALKGVTRAYFGGSSDSPVPGDYDGNGRWDLGIFRATSGLWAVKGVTRAYFGGSTDSPIPGGYRGDGSDYPGIFRGSSGLWAIKGVTRTYFGSGSDVPVTR